MLISDIIAAIEQEAPLSLQESYDNAGMQVGDKSALCTGVLLCVDVTPSVIDEAIERGIAYKEAGADIVFIESPETREEMKLINDRVGCLTLANMVEGGRTPLLKNDELEALGYNLVIYPTASTYVTTKAMVDLWEGLKRDGTTATMMDQMIPFPKFNEIIGLPRIREIEANYSTGRVVKGH